MKKKYLVGLFIFATLLFIPTTEAKSVFYENKNGVILNEEEYNYISNLYWDGYQEFLTIEDYEEFKDLDLFGKPIEKKEVKVYSKERSSSVTSHLRTTVMSASCSDSCFITMTTAWNGLPFIKSIDVMGARVAGVSISSIKNAVVSGANYGRSYNNPRVFNNGFGFSVQVPNTTDIKAAISFVTTKGGTVYGSYQHAMSNTTDLISKQYTIGPGDYGNVFQFTGNARTVYDSAPGVDKAV